MILLLNTRHGVPSGTSLHSSFVHVVRDTMPPDMTSSGRLVQPSLATMSRLSGTWLRMKTPLLHACSHRLLGQRVAIN